MSSPGPWEATDLEGEGSVDGSWAVFPKADAPVGVAQGAIAEVYAEPDALLMARAPEMRDLLRSWLALQREEVWHDGDELRKLIADTAKLLAEVGGE